MTLNEAIYKRKSTRVFNTTPLSEDVLADIRTFGDKLKPLDSAIKCRFEILSAPQVKTLLPWKMPHYLAIFSEEKEGHLENAGFMFEQLVLYMTSLGVATCWIGMGSPKGEKLAEVSDGEDGLKFVIIIAFGRAKDSPYREKPSEFKRKALKDIADSEDERLEPARLAPSAVDGQPWYFVHDGELIHTYCVERGALMQRMYGKMNGVDMGIVLAHMYAANLGTFEFLQREPEKKPKGYRYVGSFKI